MPTPDRADTGVNGTYTDLAAEYYDPKRHPTCANFREGSRLLMAPWLRHFAGHGVNVLETGAGASLVSEWLVEESREIGTFVVSDLSQDMLRYSASSGVCSELVVCDAQRVPYASSSFDLVVASLGDSYNALPFWIEAARILRPSGHVLFTTPAFEWALQFRNGSNTAEFVMSDGSLIAVPSYVKPAEEQQRLIETSGLRLIEVRAVKDRAIHRTPRSPKLRPGPIVSGYLAQKVLE
jgi:SAM-dependent methyltransferase